MFVCLKTFFKKKKKFNGYLQFLKIFKIFVVSIFE